MTAIESILIWSVDPRLDTGYAIQCRLLALELQKAGYRVAIGAIGARQRDQGRPWHGIPVRFVSGKGPHGSAVLAEAARQHKADLLLILCDAFMVDAHEVDKVTRTGCRVAYWCPVDGHNLVGPQLPVLYRGMLQAAPLAVPLAMSRWAESMFRQSGHQPIYIPHMIDTGVFRPAAPGERDRLRDEAGIPRDAFVITMCAANTELVRKNFPGQFHAFAMAAQPHWRLLVHSQVHGAAGADGTRQVGGYGRNAPRGGWDLEALASYYGIGDQVIFADPKRYDQGRYTVEDMAAWYRLGDLHTQCTLAEGFGIPLIEAQACGLPVVATRCSAMTELVGCGELIPGEPLMSPLIKAEWTLPVRDCIAHAYRLMDWSREHAAAADVREAREFAEQFSIARVMENHWTPALKQLQERGA